MRTLYLVAALALTACGERVERPAASEAPRPAVRADARVLLGPLAAIGAEPFWRLDISPEGGIVLIQAAEEESIEQPYTAPTPTGEVSARIAGPTLTVDLAVEPCSDGMSEADYPVSAQVSLPTGVILKGCAFRPWAADLGDFVTAIDRCLDARPAAAAILYAETVDGVTTVRLSAEGGKRLDCRVARDGGVSFAPTPEAVRHASEGQPTFHRAKENQAVDLCDGQEQARDDTGRILGWYGLAPNCESLDAGFDDLLNP